MSVLVHDLSETGLLLQTSAQLSVGERIKVVLPHTGPAMASVVWRSNEFSGCRFGERISRATVSAVQVSSGPELASKAPEDLSTAHCESEREESFGMRLRRLRKQRSIGLTGLARLVNVGKPTVWKWENDKVRPRQKSVEALASILEVSERELYFGQAAAGQQIRKTASVAKDAPLLSDLIQECKSRIAELAGTSTENVSVTIHV